MKTDDCIIKYSNMEMANNPLAQFHTECGFAFDTGEFEDFEYCPKCGKEILKVDTDDE